MLTVFKIPSMLFCVAIVCFHSWVVSSLGLSQIFLYTVIVQCVYVSPQYAPRSKIAGSYVCFQLYELIILTSSVVPHQQIPPIVGIVTF